MRITVCYISTSGLFPGIDISRQTHIIYYVVPLYLTCTGGATPLKLVKEKPHQHMVKSQGEITENVETTGMSILNIFLY